MVEEDCIREREPERNFDAVSPEWTEKPEGGTSFLSKAREPGLFLRSESAAYPDLRITKDSFLIGKKKRCGGRVAESQRNLPHTWKDFQGKRTAII